MSRSHLCLCATIAMLSACGGGGGGSASVDAAMDGESFATCLATHDGVAGYSPNQMVTSSGGTFTAILVENVPGTPTDGNPPGAEVKGVNTWQVQLLDATGAPAPGVGVAASPYMPDHRHPTTVIPGITDQGDGTYLMTPMYLYMSGYWEITLSLERPDATTDAGASVPKETAVFKVCIP